MTVWTGLKTYDINLQDYTVHCSDISSASR